MVTVTLKGNEVHTTGELPKIGELAPDFALVASDLSEKKLADYKGQRVVLNIFPSVDTGTCAMSVRVFNQKASDLKNTVVLCISKDLPFALSRFCAAEGLEKVVTLSAFRSDFGQTYGLEFLDGPLKGLLSRVVVIIDENGKIIYQEQVLEISKEPNYDAALTALK